MIAVRIAANR